MSEIGIGFGAILDDNVDETWIPTTETVIECTECEEPKMYEIPYE